MQKKISPILAIWLLNLVLFLSYSLGFSGVSFLKSSVLEYTNVKSDPFDGAVLPIAYVPDWTKSANTNKSKRYENFNITDFVETPEYDTSLLSDDSGKNSAAILDRYEYPVVYMGSYRGNYVEYDGSHLGVDIRAPLGTPILATANGVVVKVKDDESGDGKYVVLRHDDIGTSDEKSTYYSIYEHMEETIATEGTKVKRWDVIGKVGMSGITTTPHVHFQIDKSDAPFHGYWPYSFKEAADLGLDFFGAVNVGLGKENAIRYTIHPMEFIKDHRFYASAPPEKAISVAATVTSANTPTSSTDNNSSTATGVVINTGTTETPALTSTETNQSVQDKDSSSQIVSSPLTTKSIDPTLPFSDVSKDSPLYAATKYLSDKGVTHWYIDGTFRPDNLLTRSEALLLYARLFGLTPLESSEWEFRDVLPSDEVYPYIARAIQDDILTKNKYFRPNDSLTRAETITLLIRISKLPLSNLKTSIFKDVSVDSPHLKYINTFASYLRLSGTQFNPDKDITRGELAKILYLFDQRAQKK